MKFAEFFGLEKNGLLIAWLNDKVVSNLENEPFAKQVFKVAEEKIRYLKSQNNGYKITSN